MKTLLVGVACALLSALAGSAAGPNVVGRWTGQIVAEKVKLPPELSEEQRAQVQNALRLLKRVRVNLDLRANKTYTAVAAGAGVGKKAISEKNEGTWKVSGNKLWLTSVRTNGRPTTVKKPQALTVSADGKTLSLQLPASHTGSGKIVFKRA